MVNKPVVTSATSSSESRSQEISTEVQRDVRIDDASKLRSKDSNAGIEGRSSFLAL